MNNILQAELAQIPARVDNGIQWLLTHAKEFVGVIDLERLDIGNACQCVIGQIYGNYNKVNPAGVRAVVVNCGFLCPGKLADVGEVSEESFYSAGQRLYYRALTKRWKERLLAIQEQGTIKLAA